VVAKLNQILAVEKGVKSRAVAELSDLYKAVQKPELYNGFSKVYEPKDADGEEFPPEKKHVQFVVSDVVRRVRNSLSDLLDVTARKDFTNTVARADIKVDDKVLVAGVPVSYLLFLEKQLVDVRTFVSNLPVLDAAENWNKDPNSGLQKAEVTKTRLTKKTQRPIVLYDATEHHPAQTQLLTEDVIIGYWAQTKQSGAIGKPEKAKLLERVDELVKAVKFAREEANNIDEIKAPNVGDAVFGYLFEASSSLE
jgi:hypothetical protein